MTAALSILKTVFGYPAFRGQQAAVIDHMVAGGDALVLMPTGGGKSLCYQIPAIARQQANQGTSIVVSPLIALMHDQVGALREAGVNAAFLNSSLSNDEASDVEKALLRGETTLLYAAPERVMNGRFLAMLDALYERGKLALFAIDEAHCVSQWGHDFRPEYRGLSVLHERFPAVPRIALTATADALTRSDIVERLQLQNSQQFVSSFDRPNIRYQLVEKVDARKQLLRFIQGEHTGDSGIVYCLSRKKVEDTAVFLNDQGIHALPYHAGLDKDLRQRNQDTFLRNETAIVMVATIAFGMGIDKPDVRFVAHLDMPKNVEGYYQETGRAGRDGEPANAWLCYGLQDVVSQRRMIDESPADEAYKDVMRSKLDALLALAEGTDCRRGRLLTYFDDATLAAAPRPYRCHNCDNCVSPPRTWDASEAARKLVSCVYRVQQATPSFGFAAGHIIDVLRGERSEKILKFRHEQVSTFGIGDGIAETAWRGVLRQLIATGVLYVDFEAYQALRVTEAAKAFLRSSEPLHLREAAPKERRVSRDTGTATSQTKQDAAARLSPHAKNILAMLKAWRAEQAQTLNLPAYVIFHDATLMAIANLAPRSEAELGTVSGMGARKLAAYGEAVLRVIAQSGERTSSNPDWLKFVHD